MIAVTYQIPLEILIVFLQMLTKPSPLFITRSNNILSGHRRLFISDSRSSSVYDSCLYNLCTMEVQTVSDGWHDALNSFFKREEVFSDFLIKYPTLCEGFGLNELANSK